MRFYWDLGKVVINILSDITVVERGKEGSRKSNEIKLECEDKRKSAAAFIQSSFQHTGHTK